MPARRHGRLRQTKLGCTAGALRGTAHLCWARYDRKFRPWWGCIQLVCGEAEAYALVGKVLPLEFEGGRRGSAYFPTVSTRFAYGAGALPGDVHLAYFVGLGDLGSADAKGAGLPGTAPGPADETT